MRLAQLGNFGGRQLLTEGDWLQIGACDGSKDWVRTGKDRTKRRTV